MLVCRTIAVALEKMPIFGVTMGENFSLLYILLCRMTIMVNFWCFLQ